MIDWNYTAPFNTVELLDKYAYDKNIKIKHDNLRINFPNILFK